MTLSFGSLFAGIGGIDLGLERSGMVCKWQVEIDDYCTRVLAKHWPNVPRHRDVCECGVHNLAAVDVIAGGFPCQGISDAGRRQGLADPRSGLWREFARIVCELRPRYVLVENVAALLYRGLGSVLGDLAALGYDAEWHCIPAAAIGAPHIRDRVYIVAYANCSWDGGAQHEVCSGRHTVGSSRANGRTWDVADASGKRNRELAARQEQRHGKEEANPYGRGQNVPNTDCERCDRRGGLLAPTFAARLADIEREHPWSAEPDVGRVAYGVPFGLELLGGRIDEQGDCKEADTAARFACWQVLRAVWEYRELAETSPYLHSERLRDIVPALPCSGGFARWVAQAKTDQELRHLWESFYALPFQEAHDLQQALLERARAEERSQTMAFRKQRVNRLRGLGNAVVPQVAEWIGRQIVAHQEHHHG